MARYSHILKRLRLLHSWHRMALDFPFQVKSPGVKYARGGVKKMGEKRMIERSKITLRL